MDRTQLNLKDKTMAELHKAERENGNLLSGLDPSNPDDEAWITNLLDDRAQIRAEMEERQFWNYR